MVVLKTSRELAAMRDAGRISARALKLAGEAVEPGVSTWEISRGRAQSLPSSVTAGSRQAPVSR